MSFGLRTIQFGDWNAVRHNFQKLNSSLGLSFTSSPTYAGLTLTGLTASRLVATDANKGMTSSDLVNWVTGTANQITVTDDSDGTITLSGPQDIHTGASPTFAGIIIADGGTIGQAAGPLLTFNSVWPELSIVYENDSDNLLLKRTIGSDSSTLGFGINEATGYSYIQSNKVGTGTIQPLRFYVGSTNCLEIGTDGASNFQNNDIVTTGIVNASAGEVLVEDNDTSEPSGKSDGYVGVATVGGTSRIYFTIGGLMYYVDGTAVAAVPPVTGNPIGLLLTLTYDIP